MKHIAATFGLLLAALVVPLLFAGVPVSANPHSPPSPTAIVSTPTLRPQAPSGTGASQPQSTSALQPVTTQSASLASTSSANCLGQTCVFSIANAADDAGLDYQCSYSTGWNEVYFGECPDGWDITSGFRFANITIPVGTQVISAYLSFTVDGLPTGYRAPLSLSLYAEDTANAQPFSTSSTPADRMTTRQSVSWRIPATDIWYVYQTRQVDVTPIVQTILGRPDWQQGNALAVIVKDNGNEKGQHRRVMAFERENTNGLYAARLVVKLALSPSTSYYVQSSWGQTEDFNNQQRTHAYKLGYLAPTGTSNLIILDFGAQNYNELTNTWGVTLTQELVYQSNAWVTTIAQDFIDGYNAGHPHFPISIAVGTNNDTHWVCNNTTEELSDLWYQGGFIWGNLIRNLAPASMVNIESANDFEVWAGSYGDSWSACSIGAESWLNGFVDATQSAYITNVNFGNNVHTVDPNQWMIGHVRDISWGRPEAVVYPEIYCKGQIVPWVDLLQAGTMHFSGVTADDGNDFVDCFGHRKNQTFLWDEAWNKFNDALTKAKSPNYLGLESSVTIPKSIR